MRLVDFDPPPGWSLVKAGDAHAAFAARALEIGPSFSQIVRARVTDSSLSYAFVPEEWVPVDGRNPRFALGTATRSCGELAAVAALCASRKDSIADTLFIIVENRMETPAEVLSRHEDIAAYLLARGDEVYMSWVSGQGEASLVDILNDCYNMPSFAIHLGNFKLGETMHGLWSAGMNSVADLVFASALYAFDGEGFILITLGDAMSAVPLVP